VARLKTESGVLKRQRQSLMKLEATVLPLQAGIQHLSQWPPVTGNKLIMARWLTVDWQPFATANGTQD
jgi:hypothetical protein